MKQARLSVLALNAKADALAALLNGGFLELYAGRRPASPEDDVTGPALARLHFADRAFARAVDGVSVAQALEPEEAAPAAGVATWFRCLTANDEPVLEGTVGTEHADLVLSNATILVGTKVMLDHFELVESAELS